jgi:hypothetical protein
MDAVYSLLNLDSDVRLDIPPVKAMTYRLIDAMDPDKADVQRVSEETKQISRDVGNFCSKVGINRCNTCTPYQIGNVPVMGEHCAWMESSAVIYINSVIGPERTSRAPIALRPPLWSARSPTGATTRRRGAGPPITSKSNILSSRCSTGA